MMVSVETMPMDGQGSHRCFAGFLDTVSEVRFLAAGIDQDIDAGLGQFWIRAIPRFAMERNANDALKLFRIGCLSALEFSRLRPIWIQSNP